MTDRPDAELELPDQPVEEARVDPQLATVTEAELAAAAENMPPVVDVDQLDADELTALGIDEEEPGRTWDDVDGRTWDDVEQAGRRPEGDVDA